MFLPVHCFDGYLMKILQMDFSFLQISWNVLETKFGTVSEIIFLACLHSANMILQIFNRWSADKSSAHFTIGNFLWYTIFKHEYVSTYWFLWLAWDLVGDDSIFGLHLLKLKACWTILWPFSISLLSSTCI